MKVHILLGATILALAVFSVQGRRFVSREHESSDDSDPFNVVNLWDDTESSENDDFLSNFDFWDKSESSDDDNSRGEGDFGDFFWEGSFWGDKGSSEDGNLFDGGDFWNEDGDTDEDRSFQFGRRFKRSLSNTRCFHVACRCMYGSEWYIDSNGCRMCRCKPYPRHCGGLCKLGCKNGFVIGKDGCPICRCKEF